MVKETTSPNSKVAAVNFKANLLARHTVQRAKRPSKVLQDHQWAELTSESKIRNITRRQNRKISKV
jgi:hypothetical protein